ncbi:SOS response-associated peptidase [Bdellovibrio sp. HCB209]|uniref:SOS response-associated peptidase n=1 Tax=Bdellovibrio sp. HCB209 TaxID=3394354 RepID=UPI0039B46481
MCASYHLNTDAPSLQKHINVILPEQFTFAKYVLPHAQAPVIVMHEADIVLKMMKFSLLPGWSKESKVKFATHNARLESIDTKPTWKVPFKKNHCLIPISDFVEPIYENEFAGNMVRFSEKADQLLLAAGIFDVWVDKETGETIESFSIITHDPPDFIMSIGHDRCPLFLPQSRYESWLGSATMSSEERKQFLLDSRAEISFKVEKERPLKEGWQKRIPKE